MLMIWSISLLQQYWSVMRCCGTCHSRQAVFTSGFVVAHQFRCSVWGILESGTYQAVYKVYKTLISCQTKYIYKTSIQVMQRQLYQDIRINRRSEKWQKYMLQYSKKTSKNRPLVTFSQFGSSVICMCSILVELFQQYWRFLKKVTKALFFQGGHRVTTNCEKVAIKLAKSAKQLDINHA